jgi:hypothetical protein
MWVLYIPPQHGVYDPNLRADIQNLFDRPLIVTAKLAPKSRKKKLTK